MAGMADMAPKKLLFEDVSIHSPHAAFSRFDAQTLREQPSADGLRRCAAARCACARGA